MSKLLQSNYPEPACLYCGAGLWLNPTNQWWECPECGYEYQAPRQQDEKKTGAELE